MNGPQWFTAQELQATPDNALEQADKLVILLMRLVAGRHPAVTGAALAQAAAFFIAGHHKVIRDQIAEMHINSIRENVAELGESVWATMNEVKNQTGAKETGNGT